jgi:hypothetical protein
MCVPQTAKSAAEQAALKYAEAKLAYAREQVLEHGSNFTPELHFLHPGDFTPRLRLHTCPGLWHRMQ